MTRLTGLVLGVALAALVGCGDDDKECGTGTYFEDGYCLPVEVNEPPVCGAGTMLDSTSNTCVIPPGSCQGGTVPIAGQCVDPTEGLVVDVAEGAEPNGRGFLEDSDQPAGVFAIKPIGGVAVISGEITPRSGDRGDGDSTLVPDFDTYVFHATAPTLLEISADGVGGVSGAFIVVSEEPELASFFRTGTAFTGDTARRQLFLPQAGTYLLVVTDSTSLVTQGNLSGNGGTYFVSIEQKAVPPATTIPVDDGAGQLSGTIDDNEVDFYSAPLGTGLNQVFFDAFDDQLDGELVVTSGGRFIGAAEDVVADEATVTVGVTEGSSTLFVVDHISNTAQAPADYRVRVETSTAKAASTNGAAVTITNLTESPEADFIPTEYSYLTLQTTAADQILGLDLSFNVPVSAELFDTSGRSVARFTERSSGDEFTAYKGLLRLADAGRYYLAVYAPNDAAGTEIELTSTITPVTAGALAFDTPLVDVTRNAFNSNVFAYTAGAQPWHLATLGADAASGGARARWVPATVAYGLLGDLPLDGGGAIAAPFLFDMSAGASAATTQGFLPVLAAPLLAIVSTANDAGTFDLETDAREYTDLGAQVAPFSVTRTGETIPSAAAIQTEPRRYLIKTAPGNRLTVTADPIATQNLGIRQLSAAETPTATTDTGAAGAAETFRTTVGSTGYVAFEVFSPPSAVLGGFDLDVNIAGPQPVVNDGFYDFTAGTTPWMNLCAVPGAEDITPLDRDEALTTAINAPAGFLFHGAAVTQFRVSTNGFLTFETANTDPSPWAFDDIPSTALPDSSIAPFWGDLYETRICVQTIGLRTYVQWRGLDGFTDEDSSMMVVLDSQTQTIELVYAPFFAALAGTTGVQDDSTTGQQYASDEDPAGTSLLLTP